MKILQIDSSILGDNSVSRELTAHIAAQLKQDNPGATFTTRDLAAQPLAHLTAAIYTGLQTPDAGDNAELADNFKVLEEFLAADTVIIGAPMYNFGIPSQLKAWIDRLGVPGKTFSYTAEGPKGLAGGKKVIVASSRGGAYKDMPHETAMDHQEAYLKALLGFIGVTDIEFIRAEGIGMGAEARSKAIDGAKGQISAVKAAA
jgi:FMN-dependent NADH-azoreductase